MPEQIINSPRTSGRLTSSDRFNARLLSTVPWLAFLLLSLPLPLYFLFRYFTTIEEAGVYMLLTLTALALGSLAGIIAVFILLLYRRSWQANLRDRLAADGITADEVEWFMPELTTAERKTLRLLEKQNALLADAYRETLALRLTATRVTSSAKRELVSVERRLNRAELLQGTDTRTLREDLLADRARLEKIEREGRARLSESEARLQMIEAAASRSASQEELDFALNRLEANRAHLPLALETTRLELKALEEAEKEMRNDE